MGKTRSKEWGAEIISDSEDLSYLFEAISVKQETLVEEGAAFFVPYCKFIPARLIDLLDKRKNKCLRI